jgi:hypothetical protein
MSTITSDVNYSLANIIETHLPIWWIHYSFFYFFSPYYVNLIYTYIKVGSFDELRGLPRQQFVTADVHFVHLQ